MVYPSIISIIAFVRRSFGVYAQAYAPFLALELLLFFSPLVAIATKVELLHSNRENVYRSQEGESTIADCL
jgi:hypothetical protein